MSSKSLMKRGAPLALLAAIAYVLKKKQGIRLDTLKDHQSLLHSPYAMHSVTYLRAKDGADLIALCQAVAYALEASGGKLIYAGKAIQVLVQSAQLPETPWDALLLVQHPSRSAAIGSFAQAQTCDVLKQSAQCYTLLMRRSVVAGIMAPLLHSLCKVAKFFLGPLGAPFTAVHEIQEPLIKAKLPVLQASLGRHGEAADKALVVCNFLKSHADPLMRRKNEIYGARMMRMLGEVDAGLQHFGWAEVLPGQALELVNPWMHVALVYYPGKEFFLQLVKSTFWEKFGKDKKEGDTLAVLTCPMELVSQGRNCI